MRTKPSRLEIRLLGPVEVLVDGSPLVVDTKKAVALLAYLAAGSGQRLRDHLADLLWPEADPDRARATLRRTLSALRAALGERWVEADRGMVRLDKDDGVVIDVDEFASLAGVAHDHAPTEVCDACIPSLRRAVTLHRGPFMSGFWLRGCPDFDDWTMRQSEHHRREAAAVLDRLCTALTAAGLHSEAIDVAHRWLDLDPLAERAHRSLMLLHAWAGDRSLAVDAYRTCVATLDRELGVAPLEETSELYEAILDEDLPRTPARRAAPVSTPVTATPSFVGRADVMAQIERIVRRRSGLIVLEGEVGVGKTRLIDELALRVSGDGTTLVIGRAHRAEAGVAYGPVQAGLMDALRRPEVLERVSILPREMLSQTARLLPALGAPDLGDPADPTAKNRFLDAIAHVIGVVDDVTVFVIDNLHWADDATLELVSHLARRLTELGIVVVLTRRPEDSPSDHPVALLVEELADTAHVIRLDRLAFEDVEELVAEAGIEDLDVHEVFDRTRGLPFFVVEYLAAARAGNTNLPQAIRRLLLGRLAELDAIGRQILTALAVVGTSADFDTVRAVSGRSDDEVLTALDDLIRRAMVRELEGGDIDFTHEQLREVAYDEATLARRRLLHGRAASHIRSLDGSDRDPVAIAAAARHHLAAGEETLAAELSVLAGDLAAGVFANADAVDLYETALALGHVDRGPIHHRLGEMRTRVGAYGAALASFEAARSAFSEGEGRHHEAARTTHSIGEIHRRLQRWDMASAAYEEAWRNAEGDVFRSIVAANWAYVLHRLGNADGANRLAAESRECAERSAEPGALAHALNLSGLLQQDPVTRAAYLEQALEHASDLSTRMAVLNNLALTSAASGDFTAAVEQGRAALEIAEVTGDTHRRAALHDNLADFLHRRGDTEASMAELKKAVTTFAEVGVEPGSLEPEVWLLKEW